MAEVTLVFPHQLFQDHPALEKSRAAVLIEDELYFHQFKFHQQKIILHRATMKAYEQELAHRGIRTIYCSASEYKSLGEVVTFLAANGFQKFHYAVTDDYLLERRLRRFAKTAGVALREYISPAFICTPQYLNDFFDNTKRYFLTDFYIAQRKRLGILIQNGQPAGGKWTYDVDNRKKLPAHVHVPQLPEFANSLYVAEATRYRQSHFPDSYGQSAAFQYPVTRHDAREALHIFLSQRFTHYGTYQDAIVDSNSYLFHSVLTPALNIGLLTPVEVLEETLAYSNEHAIPINSLEGFVRQILGWREFVRGLYLREGVTLRKANHWEHHASIPESLWNGTTGVLPVDNVVHKVLKTSYSNHIERLMVMGNFMLLCEFNPDQVYRWFMELFIDAYDWVMVPNVYGMSQFADGGVMSTKPYISGSNYLLKMSNYPKGEWCQIWDALYWCFIEKHRREFVQNPRMSMMVRQLEKMDNGRRLELHHEREKFLETL